ncbi:Longin domain [Macleaya cordata]|uniref:Longin domain n=1 Tax=Macleaya cordata TaxID=56857 RepID=A0A200PSA9_MACCD|nr:Longin domain [Macleaya cordata]
MSSIQNSVYYCCVSKGNRILYSYSCGDNEIENLAALCLERTPPFHNWYFQTIRKRTFGYLMEDGYIYFTIVDEGLGNPGVLQFLEHVKDEFKKVARSTKNGSKGSMSALNSVCLQEQMVPVIRQLISSLEHVSRSGGDWMGGIPSSHHPGPSPSPEGNPNSQGEVATSTKMPLLGKPSKQEKKKMKDRVVEIPGGSEEHRRSTDRGIKIDVTTTESNNQGPAMSTMSLQKGSSSMRIKSSREYARRVWWRQVRIILAIDVVVCLVLFGIWLGICRGFSCISG